MGTTSNNIATLRIMLVLGGFLWGFQRFDATLVLAWLIDVPRDGLILWFLLEPEIARAFAKPDQITEIPGSKN